MKERGISGREIKKTINSADYIEHESNKIIATKKFDRKIIEVVFIKKNSKIIIITCYQL
jgi:hypothetical protein